MLSNASGDAFIFVFNPEQFCRFYVGFNDELKNMCCNPT